jgi:hypothetical protein
MRDLTNTPYKQFIWFIAEVVETITDTDQLGRVRIRVLGFHSEDTPNDKLPLALVMNGGAARLVEKQWVVGFFLDGALAQQPFVLGTVGSAIGNPAKVNSQENPGPNQNTSKGSVQSLLAAVEAARQKLKRAQTAGGDIAAAQQELDNLLTQLKRAESEASAASNVPIGAPNSIYPDSFPTNGTYNFSYQAVSQSASSPYGVAATSNSQLFKNIVIHDSGSDNAEATVKYGQQIDNTRGGSFGYHFVIAKDGTVIQAAPLNVRTNHVLGASSGYENSNSIGIALASTGNDYTQAQLDSLAKLTQDVGNNFGIASSNIQRHAAIQSDKNPTEGKIAYEYVINKFVNPNKGATIATSTSTNTTLPAKFGP